MKKTVLNSIHKGLGAKMINFYEFEMPLYYDSISIEHKKVRLDSGLFDISHMGEFFVSGKNSFELLQKICSNDISKLSVGKAQYNYLPNFEGGIIDDLIVYKIEIDKYMLVVNASNIDKDFNWINKINKKFNSKLLNLSDEYCLFALQGPKSISVIKNLTKVKLDSMDNYNVKVINLAGLKDIFISSTGYTGAGGFEILVKNSEAKFLWNKLLEGGESIKIKPIGLAARDSLRIEMGYCLYGNEIDENRCPYEAGLAWITKPETKFINHNGVLSQKKNQKYKLIGFELNEQGIPRSGFKIFNKKLVKIGYVTSGTFSPYLRKGIGLGYIDFYESQKEIFIEVRGKKILATVCKLPFVKKKY